MKFNTPSGYRTLFSTLLLIAVSVFWCGVFHDIALPGLYMDGVNPDYIAASLLHPEMKNPAWTLPTACFPILGSLYHGVQNIYAGLPLFYLFGTNIITLRIAQSLFGAMIVGLVYLIAHRMTQNLLLSFVTALCLATDIALIASFRTQNYIILGGMMWLLLAVFPLSKTHENHYSVKQLFSSGIFYGLSIYGYFVFAFFFPAFLFYTVRVSTQQRKYRNSLIWCAGVVTGLLPYVLGYLSMGIALGSIQGFINFLIGTTKSLNPLSSTLSLPLAYLYSVDMAHLAVTNGGNELMILGQAVTVNPLVNVKFSALLISVSALLFLSLFRYFRGSKLRQESFFPLELLPCSYLLVAGLLGQRLWAHHFSVITPLLYLLGAQLIAQLFFKFEAPRSAGRWSKLPNVVILLLGICVISGNLYQQNHFFAKLEETGGTGKMPVAINEMASEALTQHRNEFYIFPEWGFMMPFAFLTGNQIAYAVDVNELTKNPDKTNFKRVNIPYWDQRDTEKYQAQLTSLGALNTKIKTYMRKDGQPAFYLLSATLP